MQTVTSQSLITTYLMAGRPVTQHRKNRVGAGRLVAVVVTHNRLDQLKATVHRLLDSPERDLQAVVVFDNASDGDTRSWLAAQGDPRLVIHHSPDNLGGAGGFAGAMRLAVAQFDPHWLVVMDDDARPAPGALAAFHALAPADGGGVAAAVYYPDGRICEMNRPSRNPFWDWRTFWRSLRQGRSGFHLSPEAFTASEGRAVDVTSFVGFFVSRGAIAQVGYPDPRLFLYGDDGLYTIGLRKTGGAIRFEPSVRFEHDCSTFLTDSHRFTPLWKVYYYHRNLLLLYRQAAGWLFWPALLIVLPKWLAKVRHHTGVRRQFLGLMLRAIRDGLLRRTGQPLARVKIWSGGR